MTQGFHYSHLYCFALCKTKVSHAEILSISLFAPCGLKMLSSGNKVMISGLCCVVIPWFSPKEENTVAKSQAHIGY